MAFVLAYVDAVPGRLYPLVATLLELAQRGHRVTVRCGIDDVERLRSLGLEAHSLRREIERFEPDDWRARTRFGALSSGLGQFGARTPHQLADLQQAIEEEQPDVLFIDEGAWGGGRRGRALPPSVGVLDRLAGAAALAGRAPVRARARSSTRSHRPPARPAREAAHARHARAHHRLAHNPLRDELGLAAVATIEDVYLAASAVIAYTAEPFEYPRSDWLAKLRLVGPGLWEPPVDSPPWLDDLTQPLVLVTCSTLFQNDRRLAEVASAALADEPYDVVVTTADVDPGGLPTAPNVRVERFLPHAPLLERAVCVVCHAGMGITQKALAHGVPVVAVPFGRDQPEVARRVEVAGAGVRLPARKLTPERLREALRRAIERQPGAERIAAAFGKAGGAAAAADVLEELTLDGAQPRRQAVATLPALKSPTSR